MDLYGCCMGLYMYMVWICMDVVWILCICYGFVWVLYGFVYVYFMGVYGFGMDLFMYIVWICMDLVWICLCILYGFVVDMSMCPVVYEPVAGLFLLGDNTPRPEHASYTFCHLLPNLICCLVAKLPHFLAAEGPR